MQKHKKSKKNKNCTCAPAISTSYLIGSKRLFYFREKEVASYPLGNWCLDVGSYLGLLVGASLKDISSLAYILKTIYK